MNDEKPLKNIDKTGVDKLGAKLRAKFPGNGLNAIVKLDTEVDFLKEEDKVLFKEAMQAGLLLTEGQFIAREMGQELACQMVLTSSITDLTRVVRDMVFFDYKKRDLKEAG